MCRFAAYLGEPIVLDELLYRPRNSLILQSFKARERSEPLNGDGFGVGWYAPDLDNEPVVFRSVTPAWSNLNLQNIAKKTRSGCFFAHVRAATHNSPVLEVNCHPFTSGAFLWMHNGHVGGFPFLKRKIINLLSEERFMGIQGNTDTEYVFALFLDRLSDPAKGAHPFEMKAALLETLATLKKLAVDNRITETSYLNFCVTNGTDLLALRYVSDPAEKPHSLHWSQEGKFVVDSAGWPELIDTVSSDRGIIVSSEQMTERAMDWKEIPPNSMALIDHNLSVSLEPVPTL